jgi:hypothetical protein
MKRQASIGTVLLVLGLTACPDATSTSPTSATAADAAMRLRQAGDARLKLHPNGFGRRSYSAWKAQEGRPDSQGEGDHALYFQKMVPTPTVAAGIAVIDGVSGQPASAITGLSWEHRSDGHCGAGAPRWNLGLVSADGRRFTVFLGCAAAAHTPAGTDERGREWIRDSYPGAAIDAQILAQTGLPSSTPGLTVRSLIIVFDEGNDLGLPGFVHLDNITVAINGEETVFTGPMDNAR